MRRLTLLFLFFLGQHFAFAQPDTLRVMGYNVLYYGNHCQGPNGVYHNYLKAIVKYTNPDLLALVKMSSIPVWPGDKYGVAPEGFADSVLQFALDAAYPGRYAYCPFTNAGNANNMALLFYDKRKLGFVAITSSYTNITDFNTYKLYYKDPNLSRTHDTTFLYVLPTHDRSGDENEAVRQVQIEGEVRHLKEHFSHLPNFINMGDFNVRSSDEGFYQLLTAGPDTGFLFSDPPFYPDKKFKYPANWDHNGDYSACFTTSTRESTTVPNPFGTGGGAKNWYDHIFLSRWIVDNVNYIRYIPNSFRAIGNDGQRYRVGVNNKNVHENTSAPPDVIEALYQMSNKYPVMLELAVTPNSTGASPKDPEINGAKVFVKEETTVANPVGDHLIFNFPADLAAQEITIECRDVDGKKQLGKTLKVTSTDMQVKCKLAAGKYTLTITSHHNVILETEIVKE